MYNSRLNIIKVKKSREMRGAGHVARRDAGAENAYDILVGEPEKKRPRGT
jgi:hypothetical protein